MFLLMSSFVITMNSSRSSSSIIFLPYSLFYVHFHYYYNNRYAAMYIFQKVLTHYMINHLNNEMISFTILFLLPTWSCMYSQVPMTDQNTVPAVQISLDLSSTIQWHLANWKLFENCFLVIWLGACLADALSHSWVIHRFLPRRINSAEIALAFLQQRDRTATDFSGKCKPSLRDFKK